MIDDQLPHLETFARAAELSSFTAAAHALKLTQAAVSQRIHALEDSLEVSLFQRRGGRVLLTEAGRRLHTYALRILDLHRQARAEVTGRHEPVTGELILAASSVPGEHLLPQLLLAFRERHPHVEVRATVTDTRAVLRDVEQGSVNVGLVGGKDDNPHLEYRCFARDELVLVVPRSHPWGRRRRVSLTELCSQPLIVREAGSGSRWCLEQALSRVGMSLHDVRVALELGSNEGIKEAVLRGLGLAVLSTHVVQKQAEAGEIHVLRVTGLPMEREMLAVWDRRRVLPATAHLFLDLLESGTAPGSAS
jgi:LysR family transcriptional regulator, low CO2-responsive transcriptional regulator